MMNVAVTKLSCIVVNRPGGNFKRFLESAIFQDHDAEFIFVDLEEETDDEVVELINQLGLPFFWQLPDFSVAAAYNFGASMASGKVLAFFDTDVVLFSDTLRNCCDYMDLHPSWGIMSPCALDMNGKALGEGSVVKSVDSFPFSRFFMKAFLWDEIKYATAQVWPGSVRAFLPADAFEADYMSHMVKMFGFDVVHFGHEYVIDDSDRKGPTPMQLDDAKKILDFTLKELVL